DRRRCVKACAAVRNASRWQAPHQSRLCPVSSRYAVSVRGSIGGGAVSAPEFQNVQLRFPGRCGEFDPPGVLAAAIGIADLVGFWTVAVFFWRIACDEIRTEIGEAGIALGKEPSFGAL